MSDMDPEFSVEEEAMCSLMPNPREHLSSNHLAGILGAASGDDLLSLSSQVDVQVVPQAQGGCEDVPPAAVSILTQPFQDLAAHKHPLL